MYGAVIQALRKKHRLSQKELSDHVGIGVSSISMWEAEKREPSLENLQTMAELFDVSVDYILYGKEEDRRLSKEQAELLDLFNQLSENYRAEIKGIMKGIILSSSCKN